MQQANQNVPGLVVAGLSGGSGKTVISLGLAAAWRENDLKVAPFKKGPDYIDAGWLSLAAGRACYNLDTYLCTSSRVQESYLSHSENCDIAVIEGNRGLFDGIDLEGRTSTAELAKLLHLPLVLVLDCTKSTRTMAALVLGCMHFDPNLNIVGVILNRVAGKRHHNKVRDNIQHFCNVPVFGAIPKLNSTDFPERHMGLVPTEEHLLSRDSVAAAAKIVRDSIDLEGLYRACAEATAKMPVLLLPVPKSSLEYDSLPGTGQGQGSVTPPGIGKPRIGIIRDSAFQFYYPDNLEALEACGAELCYISPLRETRIPQVDAIYMGGGFPETHAPQLAGNREFAENLRQLAAGGLPIYAECGGFIFLGHSLELDGVTYPMAGVLPVKFGLSKRPVGHGYTRARVVKENPYFKVGEIICGHEFRYSTVVEIDQARGSMAFSMERGKGIVNGQDGFFFSRVFATYTHIIATGTPSWAEAILRQARIYQASRTL
ncbi:MAG: cobyrinate a,c-diamide synthase [Desulfobacterium sp.]|jgi:cobyrinic acid a,c-diamide synthase|nr:cobyrinate a,c-diamide synthase [Desulfobacterium sp.]